MPQFNKRRINRQTLNILRWTGSVIACYEQIAGFNPESGNRVPVDPYADNEAPLDANYKKYYIFGTFEETVPQEFEAEGKVSTTYGTLTIPNLYKAILSKTVYIDPYNNGSRFVKVGAMVDDESILIVQRLKAQYLPTMPEV